MITSGVETHGIHAGTFYNWVSKLRKAGVTIPNSESKHFRRHVRRKFIECELVPEPSASCSDDRKTLAF